MIKVGIIGCGKMADQHAAQIMRIPDAALVAVCDREPLMARDMSERFMIGNSFSNLDDMLGMTQFDVIHITTPPQSHFDIGRRCLEAGANVYVEKPFTLNANEAEILFEVANQKKLKIIAGHNAQFTPAMARMRKLVKNGYLGGNPIHMESVYCYDFGDESYAKALLGDKEHWVRKLPGSLLQNIISHGISRIAEFISGEDPTVMAHGFSSSFLKGIGEDEIIDEVRVIIHDETATTAYFTFSSQIRPAPHQFRLHGRKSSLIVDDDHQILIKEHNREYRSYLQYFVPPLEYAKQHVENLGHNLVKFLTGDFHMPNDTGLKTLISLFYDAVDKGAPLPISQREILLTTRIMDSIFKQLGHQLVNPPSD